jgi:hypothetical protein
MTSLLFRVLVAVSVAVLLVLLGLAALVAVVLNHPTPAQARLQVTAQQVQRQALRTRGGDPLGHDRRAERELAVAVAAVPAVRVLGTETTSEGVVVVRLSAWAVVQGAGLTPGDQARTCLRVEASPGLPGGGWGRMGRVTTTSFSCPPGVELADGPDAGRPPAVLRDVNASSLSREVEPRYVPCLSGSGTCN